MKQSKRVLSNHNQYRGINAHLQSHLQETNGGWSSFHDQHIHEIARALNRILPPDYYASTEDSMQIKTRTEPDGLVLKRELGMPLPPTRSDVSPDREASAAKNYLGVLEIPQHQYRKAIVLYKRTEDSDVAITRLEVLSPANIESRAEAAAYDTKRAETLSAGINVIEAHYLHRSPPPTGLQPYLPTYAVGKRDERDPQATAYAICLTEPMGVEERADAPGTYEIPLNITVYPFGVEDSIPTIAVPLAEGDPALHLDLQTVYDTHFFEQRWGMGVYYDQAPADVDSYSLRDQFFINARSLTTIDAHQRGINLETGQKLDIDFDHLEEIAKRISEVKRSDIPQSGPAGPDL